MPSLEDLLKSRMEFTPSELSAVALRKERTIAGIRAAYAAEAAKGGGVFGDIPSHSADITPEWLSAKLCRNIEGGRANSITLVGGSEGSASRAQLRVDWNDAARAAGLPERIFNKTTRSVEQRLMLILAGGLQCEAGFYRELRPTMQLETPQSYYVDFDPVSGRSVFLLEDIAVSRGAQFCNPLTYIDRAHAEDLVQLLASLHAQMWNSPLLDNGWLQRPRERYREIETMLGMESNIPRAVPLSRSVLPDALMARLGELPHAYCQALEDKSRAPITLLHGDAHVGNFYMTGESRMGLCDWQISQKGAWHHDVTYAIVSALTPDDRRAWERDLLAIYLEALRQGGVADAPSFDEAWLCHRRDAPYCWYAWMTTIGHNEHQPDMQPDHISLEIIRRASIAILDLESLDAF